MTVSTSPPERVAVDPLTLADDYRASPREAAALASALGLPVSVSTLNKLAVRGGRDAPECEWFGPYRRYRVGTFKAWLSGRIIRARSTAEREAKAREREAKARKAAKASEAA